MNLLDRLQSALGHTYTLHRELHGGGMARVYVAEERRLGRKVVVKVLPPELATGISTERFEREMRFAASLQHANIVSVLTAGEADGVPYYTMPYVEGQSLRAHLAARGRLPIDEAVSILRDIARALDHAHERGVVHRDIKPDNVLLSAGAALVTDFGIAKVLSESRTHVTGTLTQSGTAVGTTQYMAPEQVAGDPNVDSRADLYALGCVAYELLAGRPPFEGSAQDVRAAHIRDIPPSVREARREVPQKLAALVARCLNKAPQDRPESAREVVLTLDALSPPPTLSATPRLPSPGIASSRTVPIAGGLALGLVLVSVAGYSAVLRLSFPPTPSVVASPDRPPDRLLIADFNVQGLDSVNGRALAEVVRRELPDSGSFRVVARNAIDNNLRRMRVNPATTVTRGLAQRIARRAGMRGILVGSVERVGSTSVVTIGVSGVVGEGAGVRLTRYRTVESGEDVAAVVTELTRELRVAIVEALRALPAPAPALAAATTSSDEALEFYTEGLAAVRANDNPGGASFLRRAVEIDPDFAEAWRLLGTALSNAGAPRKGRDSAFSHAFRLRNGEPAANRMMIVAGYYHIGPGRDRELAGAAYQRMLDQADSGALNNFGNLLWTKQDFAKAETLFHAVVRRSPGAHFGYTNLVETLIQQGKWEEAGEVAADALERFPRAQKAVNGSTQLLYHKGYLTGEFGPFENALETLRSSPATTLQIQAWATRALSRLSLLQGRVEAAASLYDAAGLLSSADDAAANETGGSDEPRVAKAYIEHLRGRPDSVVAHLEGLLSASVDVPYLEVAAAFARTNDPRRAKQVVQRYITEVTDTARRRDELHSLHGVRGLIALSEKRGEDALNQLKRSLKKKDGPTDSCTICRYDAIGQAFVLMGQRDSAIRNMERYITTPSYRRILEYRLDPMTLAPLYEELGMLYDGATDAESKRRALAAYRQFIRLWEHADPNLRPRVDAARQRVQALERIVG